MSEGRYAAALARASALSVELRGRNEALSDASADLRRTNARAARLERKAADADEYRKLVAERDAARRAMLDRLLDMYRAIGNELHAKQGGDGVRVALRGGLLVFELRSDDVFVADRAELKPSAASTLGAVADVMRPLGTWRFQIAGHTDNVAFKSKEFASSWELSTSRAVRMVHFLIGGGIAPTQLYAAGYADALPVDTNDTDEGRKHNRRIEITLMPDIVLSDVLDGR